MDTHPFVSCVFQRQGFCLREETDNPGLLTRYQCPRLSPLLQEWDDFLDRSECFHLSEQAAAKIWDTRPHALAPPLPQCPDEARNNQPQALACCPNFHDGACVATMPRCPGDCEYFQPVVF